jgi:hypothetical protein
VTESCGVFVRFRAPLDGCPVLITACRAAVLQTATTFKALCGLRFTFPRDGASFLLTMLLAVAGQSLLQ